jgi:hypothetical protein
MIFILAIYTIVFWCATYYYYNPTKDAPPGTTNHSVKVPAINIKGRWLDDAGFTIGAKVRVQACQGCLVMTVEE